MSLGLTSRQVECLQFISSYVRNNDGVSPAFSDVMEALNLSSKSAVHRLVTSLQDRGRIRRLSDRARSIEIIGPVPGEEPPSVPGWLKGLNDEAFARVAKAVLAEGQRRAGGRA